MTPKCVLWQTDKWGNFIIFCDGCQGEIDLQKKKMQYSLEVITCDPLIHKMIPTKSITTEENIYGARTHNWACSIDIAFDICE